jgi:hypothetical protein
MDKVIKPKAKKHYVNNKDLYAAMVEFKAKVNEAKEEGKQKPRIPHYIGESIMKISTHLAYRPNFANYTFREEMISDGIENCLLYINNFDPAKSQNPFAYFTQIIYFAFIRRIQKEKKHLYTKYAAIEYANIMGETSDNQTGDTGHNTDIKYGEWSREQMEKFMGDFETSQGIKRGKKEKIEPAEIIGTVVEAIITDEIDSK